MRRSLVLLSLLLAGCKLRQTAMNDRGVVASTNADGTNVAGRGRIAAGAADVAWSPDGRTLAVALGKRLLLWPSGRALPAVGGSIAWSPDGTRLLGGRGKVVREATVETGSVRVVDLGLLDVEGAGWTSDGWPFGWSKSTVSVEDGSRLERPGCRILDAVGTADTGVAWLELLPAPEGPNLFDLLRASVYVGRWQPNGALRADPIGDAGALLTGWSPTDASYPSAFKLSPDGRRVAVGGIAIQAAPSVIARLRRLAGRVDGDQPSPPSAENREFSRLLKACRGREVVVLVGITGGRREVWSSKVGCLDALGLVQALSWSPNGKWLAVGRRDGTVRIRVVPVP